MKGPEAPLRLSLVVPVIVEPSSSGLVLNPADVHMVIGPFSRVAT